MSRILRRALVLLAAAALLAPLYVAGDTAAASVPICCLGKGEHHCLGQMLGSGGGAPGFSAAVAKCPYSPLALAAMHGQELAPPVGIQTVTAAAQSFPFASRSEFSAFAVDLPAQPQRGPPSYSSLS